MLSHTITISLFCICLTTVFILLGKDSLCFLLLSVKIANADFHRGWREVNDGGGGGYDELDARNRLYHIITQACYLSTYIHIYLFRDMGQKLHPLSNPIFPCINLWKPECLGTIYFWYM